MRTTLTLDPDVAAMLKKEIARDGVGLKEAVNRALRRGLTATAPSNKLKKVFKQRTYDYGGPSPTPEEIKEILLQQDLERVFGPNRR